MKLLYRKLHGYKYELLHDYQYNTPIKIEEDTGNGYVSISKDGVLFIKERYAWDGPSGPTIDTKTFMRGALIHDALYQLIRRGYLPKAFRKQADLILKDICLEDGMSKFRAWYVYNSVRMFGGFTLKSKKPVSEVISI